MKLKETGKIEGYQDISREKMGNMKMTVIPFLIEALETSQVLRKRTRTNGHLRNNRNHQYYSSGVIGYITEKNPGDLRRLAVTQAQAHLIRLVCETCKDFGFYQRKKKVVEHEYDSDISCNWQAWNDPQKRGKKGWKIWKLEDESRTSRLEYC